MEKYIMVKIIETNLSMSDMIVMDHQNRVVEASSWEDYCNAFKNYNGDTVEFKSLTSMFGSTIPREAGVYNLKYDDFHLSCDVIKAGRYTAKKLAYLWR